VKFLVENGIDIEQPGEGGFTPLKVADDFEQNEIMKYLIPKDDAESALESRFEFYS